MLVMGRRSEHCEISTFECFPELLRPGDCLVLNDTRVIAARLFGRREPSGGRVEAFMLGEIGPGRWRCLLRPGRRLRPGAMVVLDGEAGASFTVDSKAPDGTVEVTFDRLDVLQLLEVVGRVPLPPYIQREADEADRDRYQTVYADKPGAVAAPTAGLHFTDRILDRVRARGVRIATVTLHVSAGTFKPVAVERVEDHRMHEEGYELTDGAAELINRALAERRRIIAVGTTSVRVLESCAMAEGRGVVSGSGSTRLFLYPPRVPVVVDGLLTNFHLPKSTLLMLVSCFSSVESILAAYRLAIEEGLRFFSYGDCMLILPD